jgi:hypothetical protein
VLKALSVALAASAAVLSPQSPSFTPLRLHAGTNPIPNIAGDGKAGSITLNWRENGNAWGYDIFTVAAGGSVATVEDEKDRFTDQPHTGEDVITSVRFARGSYQGKQTTYALVAERHIVTSVPDPAKTTIKIYALVRNDGPLGTPYNFEKINEYYTTRQYCNAEMALKTELGLPLPRSYQGLATIDSC